MKLSKNTFAILKNFRNINQSILFHPGNVIKTVIGVGGDFYAAATVEDNFPQSCAIYDLKNFMDCVSIFEEPEFDFHENFVKIGDGKSSFNYLYADKKIVVAPPYNKNIQIPESKVIASFDLPASILKKTIDAANVIGVPSVAITGKDTSISFKVFDKDVSSSNTFDVEVTNEANVISPFTAIIPVEKLRFLNNADYHIILGNPNIMELKSSLITYHAGVEIKVEA